MPHQYTPKTRKLINPSGLCMCGCGGVAPVADKSYGARGIRKGDHFRFIAGHGRRLDSNYRRCVDCGTPTRIRTRRCPRCAKSRRERPLYVVSESGCWVWARSLDKEGYGRWAGKSAHRFFYEKFVGPIPDGLEIDHLCNNPSCVNPEHLEPVTHQENMRRQSYRRRAAKEE